jgi:hypothetical protein
LLCKKEYVMPRLIPLAILALSLTLTTQSLGADIDWSKVDTALDKTAAAQGDVIVMEFLGAT